MEHLNVNKEPRSNDVETNKDLRSSEDADINIEVSDEDTDINADIKGGDEKNIAPIFDFPEKQKWISYIISSTQKKNSGF